MIAALILATTAVAPALSFGIYVPPHMAADGVRYRVEVSATDLPERMKACGIEDFAELPSVGGKTAYQFAVTLRNEPRADCLRHRLTAGARLEKIDHWSLDAQTD